jgi:hypothetical protein
MPALGLVCFPALILACCAGGANDPVQSSDPHLVGQRDLNYDHQIIAGVRAGPVRLNGLVSDAVQHLGEPDHVSRSTFRGPGYNADEVTYTYDNECISFTWMDSGVDPRIENGFRGINLWCDKWSTPDATRVGIALREAVARMGASCSSTREDGTLTVGNKEGLMVDAHDRKCSNCCARDARTKFFEIVGM